MKTVKYLVLTLFVLWGSSFPNASVAEGGEQNKVFFSFAAADEFCNQHYCTYIIDLSEAGPVMYVVLYNDNLGMPGMGLHPGPPGGACCIGG